MFYKLKYILAVAVVSIFLLIGEAQSKKKSGVYIEVIKAGEQTLEEENPLQNDDGYDQQLDTYEDQNAQDQQEGEETEPDLRDAPYEDDRTNEDIQGPDEDEPAVDSQEVLEEETEQNPAPDDELDSDNTHQEEGDYQDDQTDSESR
jgi:hypothetical protein